MRKSKCKMNDLSTVSYNMLAVDLDGLMQMLGCGEPTARMIAEKSHAKLNIGSRRVLYCVDKVREYLVQEAK